jgi:tellurite methyltransferase
VPRDWDQHYRDPANFDLSPLSLLVQVAEWMTPGRALDLACGPGRHALYLARLGWQVTAVDSSPLAIDLLRRHAHGLPMEAICADLERGEFTIEPGSFDLICDILYLQRDLFPAIRQGARPGGVFVGAIRLDGSFHMAPGELRDEFVNWKISYYSESGNIASIVARKA